MQKMEVNYELLCANVIYILCLSLQLSAALLLVGSTKTSRDGIIRQYCSQHTGIAFNEDGTLADSSNLKEVVRSTWISRLAFSYLTFGYLLSIWGEVPADKIVPFAFAFLLTAVLTLVSSRIAKDKSERFESITIKDIPLEGGVEFSVLE